MKIKLIKYLLILILAQTFVQICAKSGDIPISSTGDIQFYVDDASFYNFDLIRYEIYLMVYADQLVLTEFEDGQTAEIQVKLTLKKSTGEMVVNDQWETKASIVVDSNFPGNMVIYDESIYTIEEGQYHLELEVSDKNSNRIGVARKLVQIQLNDDQPVFLSQIEFVSSLEESTIMQGIFKKGKFTITPNPSRRYGLLNPMIYFYFEIYKHNSNESDQFEFNYKIVSDAGRTLRSFDNKVNIISNSANGIPSGFNVSALPSGIYDLVINASDAANEISTKTNRKFEVIQLDYASKKTLLTEDNAEMFGEIIRIIGSEKDYDFYSNLNLTSKARFLIQFWQNKDTFHSTDENEYLTRIIERYNYANKNFSWGKLKGWKSDRGKVLLKFGMPDNIQRYPSEGSSFPYEVWEYQEMRNYIYVYGDLRNDGRFTLLHSTREGEIYNPLWSEELNKM
ncbi:MAG: GWxTD domain-containing protein [Melioribacteraceae bacterium]|nr:GWxTD domain-containing protein [Melioribacteraceae bacterium]MCF8265669.1 GWxTD domain-containing protein [Melioribacteraceae bacterium]MCF8414483.1 GWxTD domain-containing protein [Melioribacteraceae bacterium]